MILATYFEGPRFTSLVWVNWFGFEFLIYFLCLLSQCVDCIIAAVTESHTPTIDASKGPSAPCAEFFTSPDSTHSSWLSTLSLTLILLYAHWYYSHQGQDSHTVYTYISLLIGPMENNVNPHSHFLDSINGEGLGNYCLCWSLQGKIQTKLTALSQTQHELQNISNLPTVNWYSIRLIGLITAFTKVDILSMKYS